MQTADLIHRLRIRSNNARNNGEFALADDLQLAIVTLEKLDKELYLNRILHNPRSHEELAAAANKK
jgi:hypothetical protein